MLGLCCRTQAFSSGRAQALSAVVSPAGEHGALGLTDSAVTVSGLSCSVAHGIFWIRDRIRVPTLAGGFLTIGPLGKPSAH